MSPPGLYPTALTLKSNVWRRLVIPSLLKRTDGARLILGWHGKGGVVPAESVASFCLCNLGEQIQICLSLKWSKWRKCVNKRIFGTRGSSVGFNARLRKNGVETQSRVLASHSSMDRAAFGTSLASHCQVEDMGNHCSEGCVHVKHCHALAKRGMFIVDRGTLRFLTQASLLGVDHCVVMCALLEQRTFARVCRRIVFSTLSKPFPTEVFGRFLHVFDTFAFLLVFWL